LHTTPLNLPVVVSFYPSKQGVPGLVFTVDEFTELCSLFPNRGGFPIDLKSANYIYSQTNGHPGIIGWIPGNAYQKFKHKKRSEVSSGFYKYLHSASFHNDMINSELRAFPKFSESTELACKMVLCGEAFKAPKDKFQGEVLEQLAYCLKASILVMDGDFVMFPSPIIQYRALGFYFGDRMATKPASLYLFILAVVQRCFSKNQLVNCESSRDKNSKLMEAQWQQEFYRVAVALLPRNAYLSPEYGREQGAKGQVDFFIGEYRWMIEVLRDGIDMAAHERRFGPGGQYEGLLLDGIEWVVVDFRSDTQSIRRPHPNTYHYSFDNEYKNVIVHHPSGKVETVPLLGDEICSFI